MEDGPIFYSIYYFEMFVNVLFLILNLLVSIFLCQEFLKKSKSFFKSPYFYILNSFYIFEMVFVICWVYGRTTNYTLTDPLLPFVLAVQWYGYCIPGIWEAVLGLTRCTALAFPEAHKFLFERKHWIFFMFIIYLFPFISQPDVFFRADCKFLSSNAPGCYEYRVATNLRCAYTNMSLSVLCLIFILIGIMFSPKMYNQEQKVRMERRLIIQTTLYAVSSILLWIETLKPHFTDTRDYKVMSYFFWMIQYYPSMLIIFFVTVTVRTEFATYYFSWFFKYFNISLNNIVTPINSLEP